MKMSLTRYKHWLIVGGIALVVLWNVFRSMNPHDFDTLTLESLEEELNIESIETVERVAEDTTPVLIMVEVKGAVEIPGVYELPKDARVKNVLDLAKVLPEANLLHVNQSMKLSDEMVIYVPSDDEVLELPPPIVTPNSDSAGSEDGRVNINTANKEQLMTLNGIGEKTAQAIIEHREMNGLFMHTEDIKQVSGIGDKKYLTIEPNIVVD